MPPGLTRRCPGKTLDGLPLEIFRRRYPASVMAVAVELHHRCYRGESCRWESPVTIGLALGFAITVRKDGRKLCRTVELALEILRRDGWIHTEAQRFGDRTNAVDVHWLLWRIDAPPAARGEESPRPTPRPRPDHATRPGAKICASAARDPAPPSPSGAKSCAVVAQNSAPASSMESCSNSERREFNVNVARFSDGGKSQPPDVRTPPAVDPPTEAQIAAAMASLARTKPDTPRREYALHTLWSAGRLPTEQADWRPRVEEVEPELTPTMPAYPARPPTLAERLGQIGPWMSAGQVDELARAWAADFRDDDSFRDYRKIIGEAVRGELKAARLRHAFESIMPSIRNGSARAAGGLLHDMIDGDRLEKNRPPGVLAKVPRRPARTNNPHLNTILR